MQLVWHEGPQQTAYLISLAIRLYTCGFEATEYQVPQHRKEV